MTVKGTVASIRFQNPDNAWSIITINSDKQFISAKGIMPGVKIGMNVRVSGDVETNKYGSTIKATEFEEVRPSDTEGIFKYLSSGLIKNIGPEIARRIIATFGEDTLDVLDENPERLNEVYGIGKKRIESVIESVKEQKQIRKIMIWLKKYELPNGIAMKIYNAYGDKSINILEENPYKLSDDIKGIGFKKADEVARKLGLTKDCEFRLLAGLNACLEDASTRGHTYLDKNTLVKQTASEEYLNLNEEIVEKQINSFGFINVGIIEDDKIALPKYYYAEKKIAERLNYIREFGKKTPSITPDIAKIEKETGYTYSRQQRLAIIQAIQNSVFIMTGGPGTGKTTTTNAIINACESLCYRVVLAAPTGRAAKRMTESTGHPSKTIHRLLEYQEGKFTRNESNPISADVLVIDEASMIDTLLMKDLLKAVSNKTKLIIVGDTDQLPSVGAGCVLRDIISSEKFTTVRLTEIYRQAQDSRIIMNAHQVNKGYMPVIQNADNGPIKNDFWFFSIEDKDKIADVIVELVKTKVPAKFGFSYSDIQVLSPMRRDFDPIGATVLNARIQDAINPDGTKAASRGTVQFRIGDRVMQTKNNYDKDIFNGDIGTVTAKLRGEDEEDKAVMEAMFDDRAVRFTQQELGELELAYACTVHKSQGSEYPVVIMPMHTSHFIMLKRNLVYTGITRAKKQCILVGTKKALAMAVNTEDTEKRFTQLRDRIIETVS